MDGADDPGGRLERSRRQHSHMHSDTWYRVVSTEEGGERKGRRGLTMRSLILPLRLLLPNTPQDREAPSGGVPRATTTLHDSSSLEVSLLLPLRDWRSWAFFAFTAGDADASSVPPTLQIGDGRARPASNH